MSDATIQSTVTILNGQSLSPEVLIGNATLVGIIMPAAWTAAGLSFQAAEKPTADSGTYGNVFDSSGVELTIPASASQYLALDPAKMCGLRFMKIRSGTSGTPVAQGADRILILIARPVG